VENYLADEVKSGKMSLAVAQRGIASDWTQYLDAANEHAARHLQHCIGSRQVSWNLQMVFMLYETWRTLSNFVHLNALALRRRITEDQGGIAISTDARIWSTVFCHTTGLGSWLWCWM
jgi:hypothetical protein